MDLYSRNIVGWSMSGRMTDHMALDDGGKLKYRVDAAIIMNGSLVEEPDPFEAVARRDQYRTRLVDPDNVKYIADGSTRQIIDIVDKARAEHPEITRPVQIAHPMYVSPEDMKRMKELSIIAEISPTMHCWTPITRCLITVLGEERANKTLPVADFMSAVVLVADGSDWPAGTPDQSGLQPKPDRLALAAVDDDRDPVLAGIVLPGSDEHAGFGKESNGC